MSSYVTDFITDLSLLYGNLGKGVLDRKTNFFSSGHLARLLLVLLLTTF